MTPLVSCWHHTLSVVSDVTSSDKIVTYDDASQTPTSKVTSNLAYQQLSLDGLQAEGVSTSAYCILERTAYAHDIFPEEIVDEL